MYNIALGRLWQETNTFAETRTEMRHFRQYTWQVGAEIIPELRSQDNELAGFADVLDAEPVTYIPLINASAWCGGPLSEEALGQIEAALKEQLAQSPKLDGIVFSLHGALAGEKTRDVEGHLLSLIRESVGRDIPLVISLDHHANVTREMMSACDAITAYRHCPHIDMRETGRKAARLLLTLLKNKRKPAMAFCKIPLVTPCEHFLTSEPPMKTWFDLAREIEGWPGVLDASVFAVQPWLDVPELGWSAVVSTQDDPELARSACARLAAAAWEHRAEFYSKKYEPSEAVSKAAAAKAGPVVIADGADATNGGSPGDSTCLLKEMLRQKIQGAALLTMVDPEAVEQARAAGTGKEITLSLGAKRSRKYHTPANVTARVGKFSDGKFELRGHLSMKINMGRCVVLEIGSIRVLVSEFAGPGHDPEVFRHIGLEPLTAQIVVVKATVGHMHAYREIMKENISCECPGPSPSYLERLDYKQIPRPIFPFNREMSWEPKPELMR